MVTVMIAARMGVLVIGYPRLKLLYCKYHHAICILCKVKISFLPWYVSGDIRLITGTVLAIASNDSTIRMYEIATGQVLLYVYQRYVVKQFAVSYFCKYYSCIMYIMLFHNGFICIYACIMCCCNSDMS